MRRSRRVVLALLLVAGLARAGTGPEPEPEQRQRFELATRLYAQGNKEQALDELQRLAVTLPRPAVLLNLVLVSAELERHELAVETADRLLQSPGTLDATRLERVRTVRAEQLARLGEVTVSSPVDGVEVFLGGRRLGTTPFQGPVFAAAGKVVLAARASRYEPVYRELLVPAAGRVVVVLELKPTTVSAGTVRLKTTTPGASVFIDGVRVGQTPGLTRLAVLPGERTVSLRREGYVSAEERLQVPEGGEVEVELNPTPERDAAARGQVQLRSVETQVTWSVDGRQQGLISERPVELVEGPHVLEFERGGFQRIRRTVEVSGAARVNLELRFEPTADFRAELGAARTLRRTLGFSGLGLGLAGAAFSSWYLFGYVSTEQRFWGAQRSRAIDEANAKTGCFQNIDPNAPSCLGLQTQAEQKLAELRTLQALGITGEVISGLLVAGGIVALVLAPDLSRYDAPPTSLDLLRALSFAPMPGGAGVVMAGRF